MPENLVQLLNVTLADLMPPPGKGRLVTFPKERVSYQISERLLDAINSYAAERALTRTSVLLALCEQINS